MKTTRRNLLKFLVLPALLASVSPAFAEDQGKSFYLWSCLEKNDGFEYAKGQYGNIEFDIHPDEWIGSYDTSLTPGVRAEKFEIFWFTRSTAPVSESTSAGVTKLVSKGLDIAIYTNKKCNPSAHSTEGVWFEAMASVDPKMSRYPVRVSGRTIGKAVIVQNQRVCCRKYEEPGKSDWGPVPHWY